ncbi:hypothetical protein [Streptomyces sp. NBC_00035]|uniref:hypothetical protein n=1 Tax=Streptomyces sp. NBC_00035 TaxID=2903614 RepID=UPI00324EFEFB
MNLTPACPPHKAGSNVWELYCTACGTRLLEGGISIEQLVGRVEMLVQEPIQATGRIRGTWIEVLEEGDGELWAYWVRPARNFAGYEAVDCLNPEPTGEMLSALLLAELAGLPGDAQSVGVTSEGYAATTGVTDGPRPRRKPSRWSRFKKWTRRSAEREFVALGVPICLFWAAALWASLGWDGVKTVCSLVF